MNEIRPGRRTGVLLAAMTAGISGVAVWLNGYGVAQVPDAILYTTLKNGVAMAALLGAVLVWRALHGGNARTTAPSADDRAPLSRRAARIGIVAIGLFGGGLAFILFFTGLSHATASGAAFIQKTLFVWVAVLAVPLLGERLGLLQLGAFAALLAGQVLLAPPRAFGWGVGETMILAATLIWAVEVVVARRLLANVSSVHLGVARLGIGLIVLVGAVIAGGHLGVLGAVTASGWAIVLLTGFLLAGYVATWFAALQRAPASVVTSVLVAGAIVTAILQGASSGRAPDVATIGGSIIVVAALAVVLVALRKPRPAVATT